MKHGIPAEVSEENMGRKHAVTRTRIRRVRYASRDVRQQVSSHIREYPTFVESEKPHLGSVERYFCT